MLVERLPCRKELPICNIESFSSRLRTKTPPEFPGDPSGTAFSSSSSSEPQNPPRRVEFFIAVATTENHPPGTHPPTPPASSLATALGALAAFGFAYERVTIWSKKKIFRIYTLDLIACSMWSLGSGKFLKIFEMQVKCKTSTYDHGSCKHVTLFWTGRLANKNHSF